MSAPSPAENASFVGHAEVEKLFVQAWETKKMPHSLLLCGPKGVGKATFAFRLARFVLSGGNDSGGLFGGTSNLDIPENSPVFRRIMGGSHGDFLYLTPDEKSATPLIKVEAIRQIGGFLALTPSESQWRVVIIDAADNMNANSANALLKILEEPPSYCVIILIAHQPGGLLPTIRSRCRMVEFHPLPADAFNTITGRAIPALNEADRQSLYALSHGSPGQAIALYHHSAADLYALLMDALAPQSPTADASREQIVKRLTSSRDNALWAVWQHLWSLWLYRTAMRAQGIALPFLSESDEATTGHLAEMLGVDTITHLQSHAAGWFKDDSVLHLERRQLLSMMFGEVQKQMKSAA